MCISTGSSLLLYHVFLSLSIREILSSYGKGIRPALNNLFSE